MKSPVVLHTDDGTRYSVTDVSWWWNTGLNNRMAQPLATSYEHHPT